MGMVFYLKILRRHLEKQQSVCLVFEKEMIYNEFCKTDAPHLLRKDLQRQKEKRCFLS